MHMLCVPTYILAPALVLAFLIGVFGHRWLTRDERREILEQLDQAHVLLRDIATSVSPLTLKAGVTRRLADYLVRWRE